jgi:hypothetical protein
MLRVLDEDRSEPDGYLYPASMFAPIELPEVAKRVLMRVGDLGRSVVSEMQSGYFSGRGDLHRDENQLRELVESGKQAFGCKCSKFAGALTVELLRSTLQERGFRASARDVFIRGVSVEVDLLLPTRLARPEQELVYQPTEVMAALEIKNSGAFGEGSLKSVRRSFQLILAANPRIYCAYITLAERKGYRWAATASSVGADVFTLFWHNGSNISPRYELTGDWARFVRKLKSLDTGLE